MKKHGNKAAKRGKSRVRSGILQKGNILISSAVDTWKSFIKNIRYSPWIIIADTLLVISLGFIVGLFKRELMGSAVKITAFLSQNQQLLSSAGSGAESFKGLADSPIFAGAYGSLMGSFYKIALFAMLAWIIFQGISWCFSYVMKAEISNAKGFFRLYSRFALYTIAGAAVICLISFGLIRSIFSIIFNLQTTVSLLTVQWISYAMMAFVAYILLVAYSALNSPVKKTLKLAFAKIHILLPLFAAIIIFLFLINWISSLAILPLAGIIGMKIALVIALFIMLVLLLLARLYSMEFSGRLIQRQER